MTGSFSQQFQRSFLSLFGTPHESYNRSHSPSEKDILKLVKMFSPKQLFEYCAPRQHDSFPNFTTDRKVKDPPKLGAHISKLKRTMDFWERREERMLERQLERQQESDLQLEMDLNWDD